MTSTPDNQTDLIGRFSDKYRHGQTALCQEIERNVFGCVYGATSWTTRDEADAVAEKLGLGPDTRLLDVGAGTGWPSIYWAGDTGCQAVCVDLPQEGLQVLRMRAEQDGVSAQIMAARSNGAALPFGSERFDAVFHSDVFC
jgi:2-polyprenyl-3-methyl-5-hydroxy-6-metoxy-1,4-benzoquinol methylase